MIGCICLCLAVLFPPSAPDDRTLISRLGASSASEREAAAKELAGRGPSVMAAVMDAVSGYGASQVPAFDAAAQALAGMGSAAVPGLRRYLREGSQNTRLAAVAALSVMEPVPVEATPELAEALWDPVDLVQFAAEKTLRKIGPAAIPPVAKALTGHLPRAPFEYNDPRMRAADLIVEMGQSEAPAVTALIEGSPPSEGAAAHFFLGQALRAAADADQHAAGQKRMLESANRHLERCLELSSERAEDSRVVRRHCLTEILWVEGERGARQPGEAHVRALLELAPNDVAAAAIAARFYRQVGRVAEGEAVLKRMIARSSRSAEACAALGEFYLNPAGDGPKDYQAAIQTYEDCEKARPNDPEAAARVAESFMARAAYDPALDPAQRLGYAERGIEAVDRALKLDPEYPEALIRKASLYRVKAKYVPPGPAADALANEARRLLQKGEEMQVKRAAEAKR